jgi:hypothetical protein
MVHVVGVQARRIQRFVFHSPQLRHMVGASELVEALCTALASELLRSLGAPRDALRVSAAGKAWLRLEDRATAQRFVERFPVLADLHAPGLHVDVALGEGADERVAYDAASRALQRLAGCPRVACAELSPLVDRARHTGGAALGAERWGGERHLVDAAMARQGAAREHAQERLRTTLGTPSGLQWPTDLDALADEAQPLAVLHADGNGFGQVLDRLSRATQGTQPLETQRQLSEAIGRASTAALRTAVERLYEEAGQTGILPARPLVFGGDDLTLIVRADHALDLTRSYLDRFEQETEAELGRVLAAHGLDRRDGRLSACAGLAVVKRSFPFSRAYELAESLCAWAKERSRLVVGGGAPIPSSLAFHRVTASIVGDFHEVLETELRGPRRRRLAAAGPAARGELGSLDRPGLQLAAGPYTVGSTRLRGLRTLAELETLADRLGRVARGPRRRLLSELKRDPDQADLAWRRMLQVAGPGADVEAARRNLDGDGSFDELESTSLLDAHVLDFLRARPGRTS